MALLAQPVLDLLNQTSTPGDTFNLGPVNAGDTITFVLRDLTSGTDMFSVPSLNGDTRQHIDPQPIRWKRHDTGRNVYSLRRSASELNSDFDYNDDLFVFSNLATTTDLTPIPSALPLFASGVGLVGLLALRRKRKVIAI